MHDNLISTPNKTRSKIFEREKKTTKCVYTGFPINL